MDPHTFSEGMWALQAYINSLQSPSQKVGGSIGPDVRTSWYPVLLEFLAHNLGGTLETIEQKPMDLRKLDTFIGLTRE